MIAVQDAKGTPYFLWFFHDNKSEFRGTSCQIFDKSDSPVGDAGNTVLYRGDNYNRSIGRKLSLSRALKNAKFSREDRRAIWARYFEVCKYR